MVKEGEPKIETIPKGHREDLPEEYRLPEEEFNKFAEQVKLTIDGDAIRDEKYAGGMKLDNVIDKFLEKLAEKEKLAKGSKDRISRADKRCSVELERLFEEAGTKIPFGVIDSLRSAKQETVTKRKQLIGSMDL